MWFYAKDGEQHGPVEAEDIRNRLKSGELSNETLVWREGMAQWSPLGEVLELREPVPAADGAEASSAVVSANPNPTLGGQAAQPMTQPAPQLVAPVQQNTMALVSMILGIVSIVMCMGALTGIPAIICGHIARKQFRESPTPQTGEGMATAGLLMGYILTILTILGAIAYGVFFFMLVKEASSAVPAVTPTP